MYLDEPCKHSLDALHTGYAHQTQSECAFQGLYTLNTIGLHIIQEMHLG